MVWELLTELLSSLLSLDIESGVGDLKSSRSSFLLARSCSRAVAEVARTEQIADATSAVVGRGAGRDVASNVHGRVALRLCLNLGLMTFVGGADAKSFLALMLFFVDRGPMFMSVEKGWKKGSKGQTPKKNRWVARAPSLQQLHRSVECKARAPDDATPARAFAGALYQHK